jgi:hypothetical protein
MEVATMFKLLILFPLFLLAAVAGMALLPLLFVLPALLIAGGVGLALVLGLAMLGLAFRLVAWLLIGAVGLAVGAAGLGLLVAGGAIALALSVAIAHLLLPILLVVGLIWLIRRASKPAAPLQITHNPT